jgi:hypothetical protein
MGEYPIDPLQYLLQPPPLIRARRLALFKAVQCIDDLVEGETERLQRLRQPDPVDGSAR